MNLEAIIKKNDTNNQFKVLLDTYKQPYDTWHKEINLSSLKNQKFSSIIFCGLGGSAISGNLISDYLYDELKTPFSVVRGYNLPAFADENSLVILSTYSGNTEETISCFNEALTKKVKSVVISSGGKITEIASLNNIPVIKIPAGLQPRYALGFSFFSLLKLMQELGFAQNEDVNVSRIIDVWRKRGEEYSAENNFAVYCAEQIIGYIPVIYSAEFLTAAGYRLKCQLNENSKLHAFYNSLPEVNHNEIMGWENYNEAMLRSKIIFIIDKDYHSQTIKQFDKLNVLLKEIKAEVITISSDEKNRKVRIMDLIFLADWISFYASVLRGFDPSEIDFIHRLKRSLLDG